MRKRYKWALAALLISLFIYVGYRTENTVINEMLLMLISAESFAALQSWLTQHLPLPELAIYSLPGGLWVFASSLLASSYFLKIGKTSLNLSWVPVIFAVGLEVFQATGITLGRFDWWDVAVSVVAWAVARLLTMKSEKQHNILAPLTVEGIVCLLTIAIVSLAHVHR